jgi:hypothetical protein
LQKAFSLEYQQHCSFPHKHKFIIVSHKRQSSGTWMPTLIMVNIPMNFG